MKDAAKSTVELIAELEALRQRVAELEAQDVTEARQAREAEAFSREMWQRLIQQLPIGVEIFDLQGFTIGLNQALMDIFGIVEPEKIIGHFNLFTDHLAAETGTQAAGREALAGRIVHLPEVFFDFSLADPRFNRVEGHRVLAVTFFPIRNSKGEVVQIVALNEDVTHQRLAEEALRESEERYRRLIELFPDGVVIHCREQVEFINPAGACILGAVEPEEIVGRSIYDFIPPEYHDFVRKRHNQLLEKGDRIPLSEQKICRTNGHLLDVEVSSISTTYRGQPAVQTVLRDITERKQLQLELARFRAMMDQSGEAIFVVDPPSGRLVDVNETASRLLGYTREELKQLSVMDIVSEEGYTLARWQERAKRIKAAQSPMMVERVYKCKDGATFPVEVMVSYRNFEGQDYVLAVARDISQLAHLEAQLRQAQKLEAVGQLAAGVAHNFNNMLTAIMGYVGLALDNLPAYHPVTSDLEGVQRTAQRAAKLTQQLLAFTRSQVIQPRLLNLNELVINMKSMLRQLISETIELEILPAPELGQVKIDPGQFEQVLVNLVVNARDAMPEGGKLTIATANIIVDQFYTNEQSELVPGNYVRLSVTDTGTGMTREVKERIFEPFFTTKEVGKGTGLGLATCFGIVKQSQGYIMVQSEAEQGSTFEIYLPQVAILDKK